MSFTLYPEEIKYKFKYLFHFLEFNPQPVALTVSHLCHCATTDLNKNTYIFIITDLKLFSFILMYCDIKSMVNSLHYYTPLT